MKNKVLRDLNELIRQVENMPPELVTGKYDPYDYKAQKLAVYKRDVDKMLSNVKMDIFKLCLESLNNRNEGVIFDIIINLKNLNVDKEKLISLKEAVGLLNYVKVAKPRELELKIPVGIPTDIRDDIVADMKELQKSYNSTCYRAAVILCGRVLETALHRKYYDTTGFDILEKNPGIGLGKLIAKLDEKNVKFDPGLTQQIHLINQVRIYSVHRKKEVFYPSSAQCYAMILYTMDVLGKMF